MDDQRDEQYGKDERGSQLYEKPIEELDLSVRVFNSLKRTGITTIGDVLDMLDRGPDAMLAIRNFGEKSLDELVEKLKEKGYLDGDVEIPTELSE
jgi:DNA-directed RNA polymerase subunit alpha